MHAFTRKNAAIAAAAALVICSLLVANYVAWLRLKPEMSAVGVIADKPDYDSHVVNVHNRAIARSHGGADALLPIYDVQNPGFFLLVAESYARAGASTPVPLEITSIVLFNIGAISFFAWVYLLFGDVLAAGFATAFLALSQFFLFFPGTTHTFPYEFVFFNLTMLFFTLFLKTDNRTYLYGALIAMFMTCMNYWFYYMSSWIIMVGLWWQYRGRPRIRDIALISAPPVTAATLTAAMVMSLSGGVVRGAMRLADIFVARTIDARIPGGTWYPDQRFMGGAEWHNYPDMVITRLHWAYSFDFWLFATAAGCTAVVLLFRDRRALVTALILLAGGFSWYYVMFQHTHIHHFVGQYSFMAICPIFGLIAAQTIHVTIIAVRRLLAILPEWRALLRPGLETDKSGNSELAFRVGSAIGTAMVAAVLLKVGWNMILPYANFTSALVKDTARISSTVEAKYADAVKAICREHSQVTLQDLQAASKDWGFEWRPQLITETNQTPKCSASR